MGRKGSSEKSTVAKASPLLRDRVAAIRACERSGETLKAYAAPSLPTCVRQSSPYRSDDGQAAARCSRQQLGLSPRSARSYPPCRDQPGPAWEQNQLAPERGEYAPFEA